MPTARRAPVRLGTLTVIAAAVALAVAACGSGSSASRSLTSSASASAASAAQARSARRAKLVACLRSHGITLPARPPGARPGAAGTSPSARRHRFGFGAGPFANPKLRAALVACGAGRFLARRPALAHAAVIRFAACVARHGYKLPAPNFSGSGPIYPASIARSARFQKAARPCASLLRPAAGAAGAQTASTRTGT
ncbi:MAG TPA: hypothetical protein VKV27_05845 [Solirubrobacteraceae bacterium]|nr:hypothetical protein [Solirubrobacteraceae bacterium]